MPLTPAGYQPRTQLEILESILTRLGDALGISIPALDSSDPLVRLATPFAAELAGRELEINEGFVAWDPNTARGAQQDRVLSANATRRRPGSAAAVRVRLTGTPTLDLTGAVVRDPEGDLWVLPVGSVIGGSGGVVVECRAVEEGAKAPTLGAWSYVGTPPTGFQAVQALEQVGLGSAAETDPEARERLKQLTSAANASEPALYRALSSIPGVDIAALRVYNKRTALDPPAMAPIKSVSAVVLGGNDTEIASALLTSTSGCQSFYGFVTAQGSFTTGGGVEVSRDVQFTRPLQERVFARATLVSTPAPVPYPPDGDGIVRSALASYSETLRVGDPALDADASQLINESLPKLSVVSVSVQFSGSASGPWDNMYTPEEWNFPRITNAPTPASVYGTNIETYAISAGWTLELDPGSGVQFVVFPAAPAASAQDVADIINASTTDIQASAVQGRVLIETVATGSVVTLEIALGSTPGLLAAIGLSMGLYFGRDTDIVSVTVL